MFDLFIYLFIFKFQKLKKNKHFLKLCSSFIMFLSFSILAGLEFIGTKNHQNHLKTRDCQTGKSWKHRIVILLKPEETYG